MFILAWLLFILGCLLGWFEMIDHNLTIGLLISSVFIMINHIKFK